MVSTKCLFGSLAIFVTVLLPVVAGAETTTVQPLAAEAVSVSGAAGEELVVRPTVVATTNITDAEIVMQSGHEVTVLFNLYNEVGVQPGVVYGIEIFNSEEGKRTLVDVAVYGEKVVTLGAGETLPVAVTYRAPSFLTGVHEVWVVAKTESGMLLSLSNAGLVVLQGSGDSVTLTDCVIEVAGETHALAAGVDIAADESVAVSCVASLSGSEPREITPQFTNYERSLYGPITETAVPVKQSVILEPGVATPVTFVVPTATQAQAYDAAMRIVDSKTGEIISSLVAIHYVVQGESATVQNVVFDKASYVSGEVANLLVTWSVAADAFAGSRGGGTEVGPLSMQVALADKTGAFCSAPTVVGLQSGSAVSQVSIPVTRHCVEPQVIVGLSTLTGLGLATEAYEYTATVVHEELQAPATPVDALVLAVSLIVLIIVLSIVAIRLVPLFRTRRIPAPLNTYEPTSARYTVPGVTLHGLLVSLVLGGSFFLTAGVPAAEALTLSIPSGYDTITFTVNTNKSTYLVDEPVRLFGAAFVTGCGNAIQAGGLEARDGQGVMQTIGSFNLDPYSGGGFAMFDRTIAGYSTPGSKLMNVRGYVINNGVTASALGNLPLSVVCPDGAVWDGASCVSTIPAPTATISGNGCEIAVGESTCVATINWQIDHATEPVVRNVTLNTIYSYDPIGASESRTITGGVNVVVAYNATDALATTPLIGTCEDGSQWNGSVCAPITAPSATITATSCEIPAGAATCPIKLTWDIQAATTPNVYNETENVQYRNQERGTEEVQTIARGTHRIQARDGGTILDTTTPTATCIDGTTWDGSTCVLTIIPEDPPADDEDDVDSEPTLANLMPVGVSLSPSTVFNLMTGVYDTVYVQYSIRNEGETDAGSFTNRLLLDRDANGTNDEIVNDQISGGLQAGTDTPLTSLYLASNVPFGTHRVIVKADVLDTVVEESEDDNETSFLITIPVPDPRLELVAEPKLLRSGQTTRLRWNTNALFPMDCVIRGPQAAHQFDPSVNGAVGSLVTGSLESKSTYLLRCTEPSTGTVFSVTTTVEVIGRIEEI